MISQFKKCSDGECVRNKNFHRHPIYNSKIYHPTLPEREVLLDNNSSKFKKKYHPLNDTFTINSGKQESTIPKYLPKLNGQQNQVKKMKFTGKKIDNMSFNPFQSVVYTTSPFVTGKKSTSEKVSNSTQTPRFEVPQRQKQSIQRYVERNLKLHQKENEERVKFHQSNSLTYLPRVFLPRINLYNKNNIERDSPSTNLSIYDYLNINDRPTNYDELAMKHYDQTCHNCCIHNDNNVRDNLSDSTDSITDCIHFSYPNNHFPERHTSRKHYPQHNLNIPSSEKVQYTQVLKSPIMWGNNNNNKKKPTEDDSDSSDDEWKLEIEDEIVMEEPRSKFTKQTFNFWRDDDNFDITDTPDETHSNPVPPEKHVRFD